MNHDNPLVAEPIPRLLKKLAIPASTGFFFNIMFAVTDTWYAGMVSTEAVAALSITFPVFFLVIALGVGIATGATALIGQALGAGNREEGRLYALQSLSFGIIHALLLSAAGYFFAPAVFRSLGASGEYLQTAVAYMNVIFAGTVFFIINYVCNAILSVTGDTRSFRNVLIAGFFLNLLLDPLFLFGGFGIPALGVPGIAVSTIVIQFGALLYMVRKITKSDMLSGCCFSLLIPRNRTFLDLVKQGFPAMLNTLTVALGVYIITWFVSDYGTAPVAAYGIGTRLEQLALLPLVGLNMAVLTLVAQNTGARRFDRVRDTMRIALRSGLTIVFVMMIVVYSLAPVIMNLFTDDGQVVKAGVDFLRVDSLVLCAYLILYVDVAALQGMKLPLYAVVIGLFRQIAAPIPVFYFLSKLLHWELTGVWWGIFMVNWTAALLTLGYVRYVLNKLGR